MTALPLRIVVHDLAELPALIQPLMHLTSAYRRFYFKGEMGSGKTTTIAALCRALGCTEPVSSPTFALVNEYQSPTHGRIVHTDWYRLSSLDELNNLGWELYEKSNSLLLIEWPDSVPDYELPTGVLVELFSSSLTERHATLTLVP